MRKTLLLLLLIASFAGCRKQNQSIGPREGDNYVNVLFPNQAYCTQFQQSTGGMMFNCHQALTFKKDHKATAMVTDILNIGTYSQVDEWVVIKFSGPGDAGSVIKLKVIDRNTLFEPEYNIKWKRCKGPTAWDLY